VTDETIKIIKIYRGKKIPILQDNVPFNELKIRKIIKNNAKN
jgi:hypothetical protein